MNYLRERLSFFPWMLIPVFVYYLGGGRTDSMDWNIFAVVFWFVLFLRVLDDYACFEFDRSQGKKHAYLRRGKVELIMSAVSLGLFLAFTSYLVLPQAQFLQTIAFVGLHIPLYLYLREHPAIVAVSLAKYPFLFYLVASHAGQEAWWWSVLGSLYFVAREAIEEVAGLRNRVAEIAVALGLVLAKYLTESL